MFDPPEVESSYCSQTCSFGGRTMWCLKPFVFFDMRYTFPSFARQTLHSFLLLLLFLTIADSGTLGYRRTGSMDKPTGRQAPPGRCLTGQNLRNLPCTTLAVSPSSSLASDIASGSFTGPLYKGVVEGLCLLRSFCRQGGAVFLINLQQLGASRSTVRKGLRPRGFLRGLQRARKNRARTGESAGGEKVRTGCRDSSVST